MFDAFKAVFLQDSEQTWPETIPSTTSVIDDQLRELLACDGGKSFNRGIYRLLPLSAVCHWNNLVLDAFPGFAARITCFAVDWLGRVFALDSARLEDGRPGVVMFEPGTAEALEIPCNIETFHDVELLQYREEALAESFYRQWLKRGGVSPLTTQCIGYKKPLFLNGSDTLDNLEVSDLDVYWTIAAQLIQKTRGLPLGTPIGKVTAE